MAEELSGQAVQLSETISFFKLGNDPTNPEAARKPVGTAQKVSFGTSAGTPRAKTATQAKPMAAQVSPMPKTHAREGIVLNLDDDCTAHAGMDADDANFKEF